ncbi:hypothetical protein AAGS40_22510 [Paraburkholderia sp. PREW-6R]|uniref:hypothetical protein n=1 Tax=Paraburkholderia sp. PREW-6R TaxID=3141544 RepID=UPI0031F4CDA8
MANVANPASEPERQPEEDPGSRPTKVSKPIGDAIPTPVEPGLDQPLPKKGEALPTDTGAEDAALGDTETPPGVPPPGESDFA